MVSTGSAAPDRQRVVAAGAVLSTATAAGFDLYAGEAPLHAATLGVIAGATALLRIRLGSQHCLLQFVSGCVVLQPALHLSLKLLPHGSLEHGTAGQAGPADLLVIGSQIALILLAVTALTFAEQIVELVTGALRTYRLWVVLLVASPGSVCLIVRFAPASRSLISRYRPGSFERRGPPFLSFPVAGV